MDYKYTVKTTHDTPAANPVKTALKLTAGTITKVWLFHPEGCHGLAYASIWVGGHQLYPSNPDSAYHGNDVPMEFEDNFELESPAELTLKTWNLDTKYDHTLYLRITVLRGVIDTATKALLDALAIIKALLTGKRIEPMPLEG
jgi:hypothetical protein